MFTWPKKRLSSSNRRSKVIDWKASKESTKVYHNVPPYSELWQEWQQHFSLRWGSENACMFVNDTLVPTLQERNPEVI